MNSLRIYFAKKRKVSLIELVKRKPSLELIKLYKERKITKR